MLNVRPLDSRRPPPHARRAGGLQALLLLLALAIAVSMPGGSGTVLSPAPWASGAGAVPAAVPPPTAVITPAEQESMAALEHYLAGSELVEASGPIRAYRKVVDGGQVAFVVAPLEPAVTVTTITADGATLGSDATGDTIWADGGQHLQQVATMFAQPYAQRSDMALLAAMAFGFHGGRTSDEGTVVIDGVVQRVNGGRGAVCITERGQATIGLFDPNAVKSCVQAFGAGPVILWDGKIANPDVREPTDEFLPFNPLGEDFAQLDWRIKIYTGDYPKTAIGIGNWSGGRSFLVLMVSYGIRGTVLAEQLRAMGCASALGGDDDTSTQLVWRGQQLVERSVRAVPTAVAVYLKQ